MSNATYLLPLAPGHERHFIFPVYLDQRGFYGCITEIWQMNPDGQVMSWNVIEDYPQDELLAIAGLVSDCCNHGLVSWEYFENGIAKDLYFTWAELDDQEPTPALEPANLRADLEATLDQILGRS